MRRHSRRPSIFGRTAFSLLVALILLQAMNVIVGVYLVVLPLARNSVDDLAAVMTLAAQTYTELPPETRQDFLHDLKVNHRLTLQEDANGKTGQRSYLPYARLLEQALERRLQQPVKVNVTSGKSREYWVDVHLAGHALRIAFPHERIGTHSPTTLLTLLLISIVVSIITALVVARRITGPLVNLSLATYEIGYGQIPTPLPETGPRELATLARNFNRMAKRVRALLDTRTTLLAGISHDLRSPIARLRLAIELLKGGPNVERLANMERDLEDMDALIGQLLDIAREVRTGQVEPHALASLVSETVSDVRRSGALVDLQISDSPCVRRVNVMAFQRVLVNLLENALRHGRPPVVVSLSCTPQAILEVKDRGPGIPADQRDSVFQPFVTLGPTSGSGLGLAIVQGIVHAYGWEITLEPQPGGGTIARLVIPYSLLPL